MVNRDSYQKFCRIPTDVRSYHQNDLDPSREAPFRSPWRASLPITRVPFSHQKPRVHTFLRSRRERVRCSPPSMLSLDCGICHRTRH